MKGKVKDPVQKFGGRPIPGMVLILLLPVILIGSGAAWYWSADEGGYENVDKLASVKCLGCLGLDPVVPGFSEFWIEYPDDNVKAGQEVKHPDITLDNIDEEETDILILFFWTQGCVPCAEQWDEMREENIASGDEDGGREGEKYEKLTIYSLDAAEEMNVYRTYTPKGTETGVPMTTFIFRDPDNNIQWWSHYGRMDLSDLENMIVEIQDYLEAERLKKEYDDITSAEDHH